jgi:outer membrane protein assembly factor BamE
MPIIIACSGVKFSDWHFPYMMPVQEGNCISDKEFNQLKIGMTKEEASYIIGHPLTQFLFDENRWDFMYQSYKNNDLKKSYNVTILFDKNNKIKHISKSGELLNQ